MPEMLVKCTVCGREENPSASTSLAAGWPKCCGYTMRLESTKEFIEAVERGSAMSWLGDDLKRAGAQIKHHDLGQDRA